ncbi:MAG: hypothetical protein ACRDI0_11075 [Actinomycetota bacterium]
MPIHSHGSSSHDHPDAPVGHTHPPDPGSRRTVVEPGPTLGGLTWRVSLTILGAAGMIVGAFLSWLRLAVEDLPQGFGSTAGTRIDLTIFISTTGWRSRGPAGFFESAGLVAIVLGLVALLGFAFRRGWLTSLAGLGGIAVFALVLITLYRAPPVLGVSHVGVGLWLVLVGGLLALIGGFFASRAEHSRR